MEEIIYQNNPELPNSWTYATFKDISDVNSGYGFPKIYQGKIEGEIPFFKVKDISKTVLDGNISLEKAENYISSEELKKIKAKTFNEGTIVFAKIGEAIKLNRRAILNQESIVDNNVMGVSVYTEAVNNLFMYYFLLTIKLGEFSRATTVPSVRKGDVENILLPLPPLNEQNGIVSKIEELFTKLDAGIQELTLAKEKLKIYRQSVLKHAFEGKLTEEWREAHKDEIEDASVLLKRIKNEKKRISKRKYTEFEVSVSEIHDLPENWVWTTLSQIALIMSGKTPKGITSSENNCKFPFFKVSDMNTEGNEKFMFKSNINLNQEDFEKYKLNLQEKGTVIFPKRGGAISTNKKRVLNEPSAYDLNIMGVYPLIVPYEYFYHWISKIDLMSLADGSNVPQINHKDIDPLNIPLPPLDEQKEIIRIIDENISVIEEIEKSINQNLIKANRLRQSILKKAFSGQLVPQDPNDEPAEQLLQRIKARKKK